MPIPAMQVTYGPGDIWEPPDPDPEPANAIPPRWVYRRPVDGGPIEPLLLEDAGRQLRGTTYYPWHWIALLSHGQIIPTATHYYGASRRDVEAA